MELVLTRIAKRKGYTIGRLSLKAVTSPQASQSPQASPSPSEGGGVKIDTNPSMASTKPTMAATLSNQTSPPSEGLGEDSRLGEDFLGEAFCDTLEPTALELKTKVSKEVVLRSPAKAAVLKPFAIPEGRYAVVISWSPKMKKWLPILLGVPMFSGIRIHAGNTAKDTKGCILVGQNLKPGMVLNSNIWLHRLKQKIVEAKDRGEAVWITIR